VSSIDDNYSNIEGPIGISTAYNQTQTLLNPMVYTLRSPGGYVGEAESRNSAPPVHASLDPGPHVFPEGLYCEPRLKYLNFNQEY
jgi:hypothetical protein